MHKLRHDSWTNQSWNEMRIRLERLTLDQLISILKKSSIKVDDYNFVDKSHISAKEQVILLLDEEDRDTLLNLLKKIS